jgi:hypothetical protein
LPGGSRRAERPIAQIVERRAASLALWGRRLVGLLFFATGVQQTIWIESFAASVGSFTVLVPATTARPFSYLLAAAEVVLGLWLVSNVRPLRASAAGGALLAIMFAASTVQIAFGDRAWRTCLYPGQP